jgi:hypothetical protein
MIVYLTQLYTGLPHSREVYDGELQCLTRGAHGCTSNHTWQTQVQYLVTARIMLTLHYTKCTNAHCLFKATAATIVLTLVVDCT